MSSIVNKAVQIGTLGLVDDVTGQKALERESAAAANRSTIAGQEAIARGEAAAAPFSALGTQSAELVSNLLQQGQPQTPTSEEIINNPFFQALSQEQDRNTLAQRAALGLSGSGGTEDALARQTLLLGNQFQQQELGNRQMAQQNRFNQLFNTTQLGANAAIGQAGQSGNLLTNIANAQNAASLGAAQGEAAFTGQLLQLGGALGGGALAGGLGSAAGGALAGSAVPQQSFFGSGPVQGGNFNFG